MEPTPSIDAILGQAYTITSKTVGLIHASGKWQGIGQTTKGLGTFRSSKDGWLLPSWNCSRLGTLDKLSGQ